MTHLKQTELDKAKELYDQALLLFTTMSDPLGKAQTLRCLGDIAVYEDNLHEAEDHLRKALNLYESLNSERGKANTLRSLATIQFKGGNQRVANIVYKEAKGLFESIRQQLWQNDWKHLDQVEYELQSLMCGSRIKGDEPTTSWEEIWNLEEAMQQPPGRAQTLDILSEVER